MTQVTPRRRYGAYEEYYQSYPEIEGVPPGER